MVERINGIGEVLGVRAIAGLVENEAALVLLRETEVSNTQG